MNRRTIRQCTAWCLTLVLVLSCAWIGASAADPVQTVYTGSVLLAVNTDRGDSYAAFTTDREETQKDVAAAAQAEASGLLPDGLLEEPEPLSGPEALLRQAQFGDVSPQAAASYRVGDTRTIYSHYADSEGKDYRKVEMVCTFAGNTVTIWHEQGSEEEGEAYDEKLSAEMDVQLPKMLDFYGDKRIDADGDGKLAVFIYEIDGRNIGGYFTVSDLMDPIGRIGSVWHPMTTTSNHCDCIHVQNHGYSFIKETCLHEYQHYIQASYRFVGKNNFNALKSTEKFINEGFSTGAEFLLMGDASYSYGFVDASKPSGGLSFLHWEHDNGNYSMAFVFSQYLRTRYAALTNDLDSDIPGGGIYKTILESRTKKNENDTMAIAADMLYPSAQYPDLKTSDARCRQLLMDFWTAVICREPSGVHGFNGESWVDNIALDEMVEPMPAGETEYPIRGGMAGVYRIPVGTQKSVGVTASDKSLRLSAPATGGYILFFDANGGTDAPQDGILRTSYRITGMPRRSGYTFLGWALTPDAESPRYQSGNTVRLTQDMTLYAVWLAAPAVETDASNAIVRQGAEACNNYRFVPPADGIYKLTLSGGTFLIPLVYDGETPVDSLSQQASGATMMFYYQMTKGTAYFLQIAWIKAPGASAAFTITRQTRVYTLTYQFDHPLVDWTHTVTGDDTYTVLDYYGRCPLQFRGWAYARSAETPDVLAGATVTLTQDTTLYAVYTPETRLTADGVETPAKTTKYDVCTYILQPDKDGMYALQWQLQGGAADDDGVAMLYEATTRNYALVRPSAPFTCALRAGETYYLCVESNAAAVSASLRPVSEQIASTLTFSAGERAFFDLRLRGQTTYTVPAYTPISLEGRTFLGWEDRNTSAVYKPGDTITVLGDTTLYAQWSSAPETTAETARAVLLAIPRLVCTLWQYALTALGGAIGVE